MNLSGRLLLAAVLVFLYAPVAVMMAMSFNASPLYALPMEWSTHWYLQLAGNAKLMTASWNSILIATLTAIIATTLGTAAAIGLHRYEFPGKRVLKLLLLPPIAIPWIIIGTSMLVLAFWSGLGRGFAALLLGHVALSIPYAILVVGARLESHGTVLEEAAATLGASPAVAFFRVTLPLIAPGVIGAALFTFAVSFDQFVVSYFLAAPGFSTLPVEIYTAIRKGFTPEINAISTIIILTSSLVVIGALRYAPFRREV